MLLIAFNVPSTSNFGSSIDSNVDRSRAEGGRKTKNEAGAGGSHAVGKSAGAEEKMKNLVGGRGALPVEQRTRSAPAPQRGGHSSFCKLGGRSGSRERGIEWYRPRNKDLDVLHLYFKI